MSDPIDRQAAIDALGEGAMVNYQAAGHNNGLIKAINVIKGLPSAQPEQQWIPCSEMLPEEDFCSGRGVQYSETVLVTVVNNGDDDDTFVDVACTADGVWQLNYPQDTNPLIPKWCKVTAWMPLPEPYRGEK